MSDRLAADNIRLAKGRKKLVMITAYDMASASAVAEANADIILIGDSLGVTVLGHPNTHKVTMDIMLHHLSAARAGAPNSFIVCDMPKGSYDETVMAIENAENLIKCGANAVKLEGAAIGQIKGITEKGIPVMGHIGLLPQSADSYKVQGKSDEDASRLLREATSLCEAGVFAIVLELMPATLGKKISESVAVPCIGIGAGQFCDGQVLVFNDLLGIFDRFEPKFVRRYRNLKREMVNGCAEFIADVRSGRYPSSSEIY